MKDRTPDLWDEKNLHQLIEDMVDKVFADSNQLSQSSPEENKKKRAIERGALEEANRRIEEASKKAKTNQDSPIILPGKNR